MVTPNRNVLSTRLILGLALVLGSYLRLTNLDDARFIEPDEYRALSPLNIKVPLFNLIYKVPLLLFGFEQEVALVTSALLGVLTIVMVYNVGSKLFNPNTGALSALTLAILSPHVQYSRMALPMVLQGLLLVGAMWSLVFFLERNSSISLRLTAILLATTLLSYFPSYAALAGALVVFPFILRSKTRSWPECGSAIAALSIWLVLSYLVMVSAIVFAATGTLDLGSYFGKLEQFQKTTANYVTGQELSRIVSALRVEWGNGYNFMFVPGIALLLGFCWNGATRALSAFVVIALSVFLIPAALGTHTLYPRHLVFLTPFLSLLTGVLVSKFWDTGSNLLVRPGLRLITLCAFLGLIGICGYILSEPIIRNTFKIKPITTWLTSKGIKKGELATMLDLHEIGDVGRTTRVPGEFVTQPAGVFRINWEKLGELRQNSGVNYLLISGIGSESRVGYGESRLDGKVPLFSWNHSDRARAQSDNRVQDFKLFKLEDLLDVK